MHVEMDLSIDWASNESPKIQLIQVCEGDENENDAGGGILLAYWNNDSAIHTGTTHAPHFVAKVVPTSRKNSDQRQFCCMDLGDALRH